MVSAAWRIASKRTGKGADMADRDAPQPVNAMTTQPGANAKNVHRYPGLSSFGVEDIYQKLFFGRKKESRDLANQIIANRLTVLYATSGLGKTSLLQAGVFPRLREAGFLPLRVRVNDPDLDAMRVLRQGIESELQQERSLDSGVEMSARPTGSWWEFFKTTIFWRGDQVLVPCLVLDQFEEIFTLHNQKSRDAIARELSHLVNGSVPPEILAGMRDGKIRYSENPPDLRIVLSLRIEYVGQLQELFHRIPSILNRRFILLPLGPKGAKAAIEQPAKVTGEHFLSRPFGYQPKAMAALRDYLVDQESGTIEPYQLQLQCQEIERKVIQLQAAADDFVQVDHDLLGRRKDLDKVITDFYRRTLDGLTDYVFQRQTGQGHNRIVARFQSRRTGKAARNLCELGLLSDRGHRWHLGQEQILQDYGLQEDDLDFLVNQRLLRKEEKLKSFTYELAHDSLAAPIFNARPYRLSGRAKTGLAVGTVGALIIVVLLAGFAKIAKQEAVIATKDEEIASRRNAAYSDAAKTRIEELTAINEELRAELESTNDGIQLLIDKNTQIAAVLEDANQTEDIRVQQAQLATVQRKAKQSEELLTSIDKTTSRGSGRGQSKLARSGIAVPAMVEITSPRSGRSASVVKRDTLKRRTIGTKKSARRLEQPRVSAYGTFRMGDLSGKGNENERPVRQVKFSRPFAMNTYEVTFEEYDAFALATGRELPDDQGWGRGRRPVINVTWEDATAYAKWLSAETGKQYRLPTEAEWEYATRAGTETPYWWGDDIKQDGKVWANCDGCGSRWDSNKTAAVGQFPANAYGLHDTSGNVWEMVQDCWHDSYQGAPEDGSVAWEGSGKQPCGERVIRGGSWLTAPWRLRSAYRLKRNADVRNDIIGFRLVRDIEK